MGWCYPSSGAVGPNCAFDVLSKVGLTQAIFWNCANILGSETEVRCLEVLLPVVHSVALWAPEDDLYRYAASTAASVEISCEHSTDHSSKLMHFTFGTDLGCGKVTIQIIFGSDCFGGSDLWVSDCLNLTNSNKTKQKLLVDILEDWSKLENCYSYCLSCLCLVLRHLLASGDNIVTLESVGNILTSWVKKNEDQQLLSISVQKVELFKYVPFRHS